MDQSKINYSFKSNFNLMVTTCWMSKPKRKILKSNRNKHLFKTWIVITQTRLKERQRVNLINDKELFKLHRRIYRWHNKRKPKTFTRMLKISWMKVILLNSLDHKLQIGWDELKNLFRFIFRLILPLFNIDLYLSQNILNKIDFFKIIISN